MNKQKEELLIDELAKGDVLSAAMELVAEATEKLAKEKTALPQVPSHLKCHKGPPLTEEEYKIILDNYGWYNE